MGPLIPLAILFGSMYVLDKDNERKLAAGPIHVPQRFSPMAVSLVTTDTAGIRSFAPHATEAIRGMLASFSVESMHVEGAPDGVSIFRLVAPEPGAVLASDVAVQAERKGLAVLGALALALSTVGPDHLLLVGRPDIALRLANKTSLFAVLSAPERKTVVPEPEPEPPVTAEEVKARIARRAKSKPNGKAEIQPAASVETSDGSAEA